MVLSGEILEDIQQSLFKYISGTTYTARGTTGIYETHFPGVKYQLSYPDDLLILGLPTLAIEEPDLSPANVITFGDQPYREAEVNFTIYGFAGSNKTNAGWNKRERERMRGDLWGLLTNVESGEYLQVYDYSGGTKAAVYKIDVRDVRTNIINSQSSVLADKYRFVVDFSARVLI